MPGAGWLLATFQAREAGLRFHALSFDAVCTTPSCKLSTQVQSTFVHVC
jgi:hypothetical protein